MMKEMKTILLIEDDKSLNKIITMKLENAGYCVVSRETAEESLLYLDKKLPDLVWLDLYLPGMDGFEFLEKIRGNPKTKDLKVVVVSVSGSSRKIELAEKYGVVDYFVKSNYRIDELVGLVTKIINGRSDKVV